MRYILGWWLVLATTAALGVTWILNSVFPGPSARVGDCVVLVPSKPESWDKPPPVWRVEEVGRYHYRTSMWDSGDKTWARGLDLPFWFATRVVACPG